MSRKNKINSIIILYLKTNQVNIFFGELNYQTISQIKAYDFASLLGDIGGQMGLFIGIVFSDSKDFKSKCIVILMINFNFGDRLSVDNISIGDAILKNC